MIQRCWGIAACWLLVGPAAALPKLSYNPSYGEMLPFLVEANRISPSITVVASIGRSVRGRQIPVVICQDPSRDPLTLTRVLVMARQHGNEPAGTLAMLGLLRDLAEGRAPMLARQLGRVCLLVVPMVNPDGADANTRANANGVDLNRDWLLRSQPESQAIEHLHNLWSPHAVLDLHELWFTDEHGLNTIEAPNADAPVDPQAAAESRRLQQIILSRLRQAGFPVRYSAWDTTNNATLAHRHYSRDHGRVALLFESERQGQRTSLERRAQMHRIGVQAVVDYYYNAGFGPPGTEFVSSGEGFGDALPPPTTDSRPTPPGANGVGRPLGPEAPAVPPRPTIRFLSPDVTQPVYGTTLLEVALAGVDDLETLSVYIDGQGRYFTNKPPFRFAWETGELEPGRHVVLVRAKRKSGAVVEREQIIAVGRQAPDRLSAAGEDE